MAKASDRQAEHYDRILSDYDRHYYDYQSTRYRERFIVGPLVEGLDMAGWRVADLACGSGATSLSLRRRFPGVELTGFDISPQACAAYEAQVERPCHALDLTRPQELEPRFDAAIIMGGLHHCAADLDTSLANIAGLLKPQAPLMMFEPNREYFLQFARDLWYRADRYFDAATEEGLAHGDLLRRADGAFRPELVRYFGGPAFFLVYNSLVFRMPHRLKQFVAPPLMALEEGFNHLPGKRLFASFAARWRRV
jgi:SAM-dependent methyltransferase